MFVGLGLTRAHCDSEGLVDLLLALFSPSSSLETKNLAILSLEFANGPGIVVSHEHNFIVFHIVVRPCPRD